jgi:hypothetical protein
MNFPTAPVGLLNNPPLGEAGTLLRLNFRFPEPLALQTKRPLSFVPSCEDGTKPRGLSDCEGFGLRNTDINLTTNLVTKVRQRATDNIHQLEFWQD